MDFVNSQFPELSHVNEDVDLDQLDFEVLPWLMNFCEFNKDPDRSDIFVVEVDPKDCLRDHDYANMRRSINSNETNNNDCENKYKSCIESAEHTFRPLMEYLVLSCQLTEHSATERRLTLAFF